MATSRLNEVKTPQHDGTPRSHGVVIDVNHFIEVSGDHIGDFTELLEVERVIHNHGREVDRGQVADGDLVGRRVLDDLRAEVAGFDRACVGMRSRGGLTPSRRFVSVSRGRDSFVSKSGAMRGRRDAPRCFWLLLPLQASLYNM